uniref:Uncharacterized protein n=1 Tax=Clastoptera arizonana TaxID=38151 RepID=A0A1B6CLZ4_9HEMI
MYILLFMTGIPKMTKTIFILSNIIIVLAKINYRMLEKVNQLALGLDQYKREAKKEMQLPRTTVEEKLQVYGSIVEREKELFETIKQMWDTSGWEDWNSYLALNHTLSAIYDLEKTQDTNENILEQMIYVMKQIDSLTENLHWESVLHEAPELILRDYKEYYNFDQFSENVSLV